MTYEEKLKSPKWQKKRLEIMQRDNFTCVVCGKGIKDDTPLQVHHLKYLKNVEPWNYADDYLITLCDECHSKVHKRTIIIPFIKIAPSKEASIQKLKQDDNREKEEINIEQDYKRENSYKKERTPIFYRGLLSIREQISSTDALVYSMLLQESIYNKQNSDEQDYLVLQRLSNSKISRICGCERHSVILSIKRLIDRQFIKDDTIYCPDRFIQHGFIKLPNNTKLKGWQLVFYAFLRSLSSNYNGSIDTWASKMAEYFHSSKTAILSLIRELTRKGYVKRMKNGNLLIY